MEEFRMTMRGALEGIVAHFGGLQWLELSEPVRLSYRKSLYRDWQRIKEMELHPAGMASLESLFIRADRAIKLGEGLELLGLLETIDLKVNQELAWQREDEVTALE
jgi:hypothetical protein